MSVASRRDRAILVAGLISDRMGIALLYIVFGPVVRSLGLSEFQFGVLIASANVTLGLSSPWWGRRSQLLGRRPVFVIGLTGYALGFILLGLALDAGLAGLIGPGALFAALLVVRLGYGLFAAGTQPAATAYIADTTQPEDRARGMALIGIAAGVGTVLGPVLGGGLAAIDTVLPLYVAAAIALGSALLARSGLREPPRAAVPATPARLRITDPRVLPFLAGWCLVILVVTGIQTVTVFYLEDRLAGWGGATLATATSGAFLAMGAAMLFVQAIVLQLFRPTPKLLIGAGFLLFAVGLSGLRGASGLPAVYGAYAVMGLGFSGITSGLNAGATLRVGAAEQGAAAGLLAAAPVLGMVVGPLLATALYGAAASLPIVLGALSCGAMGAWFLVRPELTSSGGAASRSA